VKTLPDSPDIASPGDPRRHNPGVGIVVEIDEVERVEFQMTVD
jgi:hypothetical protein